MASNKEVHKENLRLKKLVSAKLQGIKFDDGDIVLAQAPNSVFSKELLEAISKWLIVTNRPNSIFLVFPEKTDISVLNEEDMKRHGWVRITKGVDTDYGKEEAS